MAERRTWIKMMQDKGKPPTGSERPDSAVETLQREDDFLSGLDDVLGDSERIKTEATESIEGIDIQDMISDGLADVVTIEAVEAIETTEE